MGAMQRDVNRPDDDEDVISLGLDEDEEWEDDVEDAPGPDERDMDLLDGTWEEKYYSQRGPGRDWNSIALAIGIIVIIAMVLPGLLVVLN